MLCNIWFSEQSIYSEQRTRGSKGVTHPHIEIKTFN